MTTRSTHVRRLLSWVALAGSLAIGFMGLGANPAGAQCQGAGNAYSWGPYWGHESVQWSSTCDNDGNYYGRVIDVYTDGNCVDLYYRDNSTSPWSYAARSCDSAGNDFNYYYADKTSQFRMCRNVIGDCTSVADNWGF